MSTPPWLYVLLKAIDSHVSVIPCAPKSTWLAGNLVTEVQWLLLGWGGFLSVRKKQRLSSRFAAVAAIANDVKPLDELGCRVRQAGSDILYIAPGSPWQNGYVESFYGCTRRELLDRGQFYTLSEPRVVITDWFGIYNVERPHGGVGYLTPNEATARGPAY